MSKVEDGGPAFPQHVAISPSGDVYGSSYYGEGMSLRDYFAGQAIAGMLANLFMPHQAREIADIDPDNPFASKWDYGVAAYVMADMMLAARKEGGAS